MKKRLTFIFATLLVAALAAAAVLAQTPTSTPQPSSDIYTYANGGAVAVTLPNGSISHPLNIRMAVSRIDPNSDHGGPDVMTFSIWNAALNRYIPVAVLSTNTDPTAIAWIKEVLNNTPVWTAGVMENYFVPTADQFQVTRVGDIVWVNSTTSYVITLPDTLGGNFTLPPMTLMFIPIGEAFEHEETTYLTPPTYSGWTIMANATDYPAWVQIQIPTWLGAYPVECVGTIMFDVTQVYMPPST
jgi:hypothetical protein